MDLRIQAKQCPTYKIMSWLDMAKGLYFEQGLSYKQVHERLKGYPGYTMKTSEGLRSALRDTDEYKKANGSYGTTRILSLSDQHFPFIRDTYYEDIKPFRNKVDILVFNGDEQDCQSISHFRKKYRKKFVVEMIGARDMICKTIELINPKKTLLIAGNHNYRFINYMTDRLHEDLLELMPETNLDLSINDGFKRHNREEKTETYYKPLKEIYGDKIEYVGSWYTIIGKTIFAHPQAYKKAKLGTAEKVMRYFQDLRVEFDCIVMPHTHRLGQAPQGNIMLYEQGCLCQPMDYAESRLYDPQQYGFVYIVQDEGGNYIYDKSRLVWLQNVNHPTSA